MRCTLVLLAAVLIQSTGLAATQIDKMRDQISMAEKLPPDKHANALVALLNMTYRQTIAHRKAIDTLREWEEMLNDLQDKVAVLKDEEAGKVFVKSLPRMPLRLQAICMAALKAHPPNIEADRTAHAFLKKSKDRNVRVAAADLLAAHRYIEAVDDLLTLLDKKEHTSLRVTACRALGTLKDRNAIEPLIELLKDEIRGRIRYEAVAALRNLTGQKFGADAPTWQGWWSKHKARFIPPQDADEAAFNWELGEKNPKELEYYEIPLVESRAAFIMDISGSMNFGGVPSRFERARSKMEDLIKRLTPQIFFNVILYNGTVYRWQRSPMVAATPNQKTAAIKFLKTKRPGLSTQTVDAIEEALWQCAESYGLETIFLITDGAPTPMRHHKVTKIEQLPASNHAIRRRIRFINQFLKVRIHTIGIYTRTPDDPEEQSHASMKDFLQGVAEDNDGIYVEVK